MKRRAFIAGLAIISAVARAACYALRQPILGPPLQITEDFLSQYAKNLYELGQQKQSRSRLKQR